MNNLIRIITKNEEDEKREVYSLPLEKVSL